MSDRPDMPMFTIKAKDALSVPAMQAYREECERHGLNEQAVHVGFAIREFRAWQQANIDLTKLPDHKHVPVSREAVAGRGDTREICGDTHCDGACWSNGNSCGKPMRCDECGNERWHTDDVMECYECARCGRRQVPWAVAGRGVGDG